jgi:hypothetical protein
MAYTYTAPVAGVFADPRSEVRFLIQDTAPSAPDSLGDEELAYLLAQSGDDRRRAAARAARQMAKVFVRKSGVTSKSVNGLSLSYSYSDLAQSYLALADDLEKDLEGGGLAYRAIYTGGGPSAFSAGMFDNGPYC